MDLISVIVPVYKVEKYLDRCVESIVNQTYQNLEIILVDDGSPDNCGAMCDAWAAKDSRIRVIHQKNAGGGAARNAALEVAGGEVVAFVDSDDYIAPNMFSHLFSLLMQGADIAECGHVNAFDDSAVFGGHDDICVFTVQEAMAEHLQDRIFRQLIWNKLYRREVVGDVRFPVGKKIDDEFFTYRVLGNAKNLVRSEKICYAYRQQESSVMHTMDAQKRLQAVEAKVERHQYIREIFPALTGLSLKDLWFTCIYQGQLSLRETDRCTARKTLSYLRDILSKYQFNANGCSIRERIWLTAASISLPAACQLRNMLKIGL